MNSTGSPLLATKLFVPPSRRTLVPRRRLTERFAAARTAPLTLVAAPAGFGKTTAVAAWAGTLDMPVAWLALDEADNDPPRFLRYLVAALQRIDPAVGNDLMAALASSPPLEAVVAALINEIAASRPISSSFWTTITRWSIPPYIPPCKLWLRTSRRTCTWSW